MVGDAASRDVIKGVVDKALQENGRFDFFFSNAGVSMIRPKDAPPRNADPRADFAISRRGIADVSEEEWSEVMRINALRCVLTVKNVG